jgi:GNAT superfamily N-acetyltransferase
MILFDTYDVRDYHPDDAAALFVVAAAIEPLDAGQLVAWTEELEGRVENGARVWLLARGRRLAGYAAVEPLPGLPGVYDLSGGVVPARRGRGLGGRLLAHAMAQAPALGAQELSARVERLEDEAAVFLLRRGFSLEHEECLLELADLSALPLDTRRVRCGVRHPAARTGHRRVWPALRQKFRRPPLVTAL